MVINIKCHYVRSPEVFVLATAEMLDAQCVTAVAGGREFYQCMRIMFTPLFGGDKASA
jgi:hypothetical protein